MGRHCKGKKKVPVHFESAEKNILTSDTARPGPQPEKDKQTLYLIVDLVQAFLSSSLIHTLGEPRPVVHDNPIPGHM